MRIDLGDVTVTKVGTIINQTISNQNKTQPAACNDCEGNRKGVSFRRISFENTLTDFFIVQFIAMLHVSVLFHLLHPHDSSR